ncbi:MAG: thiamine pyrophosphate-binding protein [Lautropia sp.]
MNAINPVDTNPMRDEPPVAPRPIPVYEALALDIRAMGVKSVFGLMSDDTALLATTLDSMGVRFYGARHENNAVAMAEGFAAASGGLGIAIVGRGPATANAMHGAVYANRTGSAVLLISGYESTAPAAPNAMGPDGKAFNVVDALRAAGLQTVLASDATTARLALAQASRAAMRGCCVALLLPVNVQTAMLEAPVSPDGMAAHPVAAAGSPQRAARPAAVAAAAAVLQRSRKPLFIAGLGAWRAGAREAIAALAEKTGAVLATSLKAKDLFRGHPDNLGIIGSFSHSAARRMFDEADCIVTFGAGLNQRTTSYGTAFPADAPLIQIDVDRSRIGRWHHADIALIGDAREIAHQLHAACTDKSASDKPFHGDAHRRRLAEFDPASDFQPVSGPRTVDPRSLAIELDRLLPADRNAVFDAGNFLQVLPYISLEGPARLKNTHDFSSIGMGFGTAMGFAHGSPGRCTVLFIGDGAFLMSLGELETVVREDIPLVIVLMNDCAYGAELHFLKSRNMPVSKSVFPDIDYAPIGAGFGFEVATIRTLDDLRALGPMLAKPDGPVLLDCKINASVAAPFLLETVEHERRKRT